MMAMRIARCIVSTVWKMLINKLSRNNSRISSISNILLPTFLSRLGLNLCRCKVITLSAAVQVVISLPVTSAWSSRVRNPSRRFGALRRRESKKKEKTTRTNSHSMIVSSSSPLKFNLWLSALTCGSTKIMMYSQYRRST